MNVRVTATGKTRTCPHCKATILESARICPGCNHHLRFDPNALVEARQQATFSALKVEGAFRNPEAGADSWEYSVVVSIKNERGSGGYACSTAFAHSSPVAPHGRLRQKRVLRTPLLITNPL